MPQTQQTNQPTIYTDLVGEEIGSHLSMNERQTALFRIWTLVTDSIPYAKCASILYIYIYIYTHTGWNDKIVILKKTLQLYFKTFIEKINSGNLIM